MALNIGNTTPKDKDKQPSRILVYLSRFFNYAVVLAVVIVLASGYLFLLRPKYDQVNRDVSNKLDKYRADKADLEEYQMNLVKYANSFKQIDQSNRDKVDAMIGDDILPESIYTEIAALIASKNIILNSVTISSDGADTKGKGRSKVGVGLGADVQILNFTVSLVGLNYESLKDLLSTLEKSIRLYDVVNVAFSPGDSAATLVIQKYYLTQ